eukprot:scaffold1572_cov141-Skeletonema_menzelii.AAC.8
MSSPPARRSSPRRHNQKQRRHIQESSDEEDDNDSFPPANKMKLPPPNSAARNLPPRGEKIPIDQYGMEDEDAFFAAGKSPAPGSSSASSIKKQRTTNATAAKATTAAAEKKARRQQQKQQQRRREYEELEEEGQRNVSKGPAMLGGANNNNNYYQQTPKQPSSFTSRALQRAMGVLDDDDDHQDTPNSQYTLLSKVSTAAPSTRGSYGMDHDDSIDNNTSSIIDSASRQRVRGEQSYAHLDTIGNNATGGGEDSSPAMMERGTQDPPEEMEYYSTQNSASTRGIDPEEEEDNDSKPSSSAAQLDNSLEEVVDSYNNEYDDFDDDDNEGGGLQLATQEDNDVDFGGGNDGYDDDDMGISAKSSHRSKSSQSQSTQDNNSEEEEEVPPPKKQRGRPKKEKDTPPVTPTSVLRTKKSKKGKNVKSKVVKWSTPNGHEGIPAANREYASVPVSDYKNSPSEDPTSRTPGGSSLRRSRRARFEPIQWWKNERLVYGPQNEEGYLGEAMGDMPVVTHVNKALPTPYKEVKRERKAPVEAAAGGGKRGGKKRSGEEAMMRVEDMPKFDDKAFRKKYKKTFSDGESGSVWSETFEETTETKIVSRLSNRNFSQLPLSKSRKKGESKKVGRASQAFHVQTDDDDLFPGYIAGNVVLPPKAIKDAEGVGLCSQVFNVGDCQPNSLEFALADPSTQDGEFDEKSAQRFLLSKGDMFQIPPGNVYRIENHSKTEDAKLFWTIIKCTSRAEQEDSDSDGE